MIQIVAPVIIGIGTGIIYGYSFVIQQKSIFFESNQSRAISFFIARIVLVSIAGSYLLRSEQIPSILGTIGFIVVFWSILLFKKAKLYEGH